MQISLSANVVAYLQAKVAEGIFESVEAGVSFILAEQLEAEKYENRTLEEIRALVYEGIEDIERGDFEIYDDEGLTKFFKELQNDSATPVGAEA